ncbi:hypothetical protein FISHEDRAFT_69649 [Fistulina hepatica ATCC 64428]|uniref:Uncharacterized protein n=1 Tax=Fistulina hepatica ATCC 64428 TaxID=1128425 RepID=A0A0D7APD7_9AGAR|nr:hypothetical protein FISHEDRAFT_69649 [Fistulina hepatica ATCC 64428]
MASDGGHYPRMTRSRARAQRESLIPVRVADSVSSHAVGSDGPQTSRLTTGSADSDVARPEDGSASGNAPRPEEGSALREESRPIVSAEPPSVVGAATVSGRLSPVSESDRSSSPTVVSMAADSSAGNGPSSVPVSSSLSSIPSGVQSEGIEPKKVDNSSTIADGTTGSINDNDIVTKALSNDEMSNGPEVQTTNEGPSGESHFKENEESGRANPPTAKAVRIEKVSNKTISVHETDNEDSQSENSSKETAAHRRNKGKGPDLRNFGNLQFEDEELDPETQAWALNEGAKPGPSRLQPDPQDGFISDEDDLDDGFEDQTDNQKDAENVDGTKSIVCEPDEEFEDIRQLQDSIDDLNWLVIEQADLIDSLLKNICEYDKGQNEMDEGTNEPQKGSTTSGRGPLPERQHNRIEGEHPSKAPMRTEDASGLGGTLPRRATSAQVEERVRPSRQINQNAAWQKHMAYTRTLCGANEPSSGPSSSSSDSGDNSSDSSADDTVNRPRVPRFREHARPGHNTHRSHRRSTRASRLKPVPPDPYDGSEDDERFWKYVIETNQYLEDGQVPPHRQVDIAARQTTGRAHQFYAQNVLLSGETWRLDRWYAELFDFCFPVNY